MNFATFIQRAMSTREVQVIGSDELESAMTPIWIVATMDQAFIRSYRAEMGRWFLYVTRRD